MTHDKAIAVIGGTGKSGQYLIRHLLAQGYFVRMLLRDSSETTFENPSLEIIRGDARDPEAINRLLQGAQAVISTLGQPKEGPPIFSNTTKNLIYAMNLFSIRRYIVTTGISVDTPFDSKNGYTEAATEWMKKNYPSTTNDKQKEWQLLNNSEMDWTLVRLPLIELTEEKKEIDISLHNCERDKISATSLAEFLVDQLQEDSYLRQAPFIWNG
jgi:putative NADH-flavin reductase